MVSRPGDQPGERFDATAILPGSRSPRAREAMTKSVVAGANRRDQCRDGGGIVGAVAVHENDDVGAVGRLRAGQAGKAVTAAHRDDFGPGAARALLRAVAAAAVGHDNPVDNVARQFGDHGGDGLRFIEGRNDDGHTRRPPRHCYKLQRNPQLAQAAGGVFDLSALRKST